MAARAESGAFTVEHFAEWASMLVLDTEEPWEPEDWQLEVVGDIFAGFREVWMITPEENAKTTTMAGLALYHCDYTRSPWVPIGAASRDQAEILHTQAAGFVRRSPGMSKRFRVFDGYRAIRSLRNPGPGIRVYAADKVTGDGVIPTLCIVDEGHRHKDLVLSDLGPPVFCAFPATRRRGEMRGDPTKKCTRAPLPLGLERALLPVG